MTERARTVLGRTTVLNVYGHVLIEVPVPDSRATYSTDAADESLLT
jgi:hypothetical protein